MRPKASLMAATVAPGSPFTVTGRRLLFTGSFVTGDAFQYDVAPDDQHFVMLSGGSARSTLIGQHAFDRLAQSQ
jgi:hypothetical protein